MNTLDEHQGDGIRYRMHLSAPNGGSAQMLRDPLGDWVGLADYARLKADVERLEAIQSIDIIAIDQLKAEVERLTSDLQMEKENEDRIVRLHQKANNDVYGLQTQVAALIDDQTRLKAEVERLTKAGDALNEQVMASGSAFGFSGDDQKAIAQWNAAKEGQQS